MHAKKKWYYLFGQCLVGAFTQTSKSSDLMGDISLFKVHSCIDAKISYCKGNIRISLLQLLIDWNFKYSITVL